MERLTFIYTLSVFSTTMAHIIHIKPASICSVSMYYITIKISHFGTILHSLSIDNNMKAQIRPCKELWCVIGTINLASVTPYLPFYNSVKPHTHRVHRIRSTCVLYYRLRVKVHDLPHCAHFKQVMS